MLRATLQQQTAETLQQAVILREELVNLPGLHAPPLPADLEHPPRMVTIPSYIARSNWCAIQ